jgi:uncharacterized C2H2 Zn-finger protein
MQRAPAAPDPYLVAWAELRRRRRMRWFLFCGWAPLVTIAWVVFPTAAAPFLIAATAAVTFSALRSFACPRCGKTFERRRAYSNLLTSRCLHCGIERGTPKGDALATRPAGVSPRS